jgi:DNA-binding winged helix-turn-helix (wHTH) protein/TolB-like protein/Tfp pilus assembly protein PilF
MSSKLNGLRKFGKFRLDAERRVLWYEGKPVELPLKEIEMLCVLTERSGELVTKDEILQKVWADSFVNESNLSRHVYLLRKAFKDLGARDLIQTVPRRGYRFTGEVSEVERGELIVEKHTQTRTMIEIQEAETKSSEKANPLRFFAEKRSPVNAAAFVLLIAVFGAAAFFGFQNWRAKTAAKEIRSIAVLPFRLIDSNKDNERQGLGLADVLITRLSNIREINVRPTGAIVEFENAEQDPVEAGRKLNVDAVLEGTIYRINDQVRVTARLVKVSDGAAIWTGQFEKSSSDELYIQNEIALQVADLLAFNLSGGEKNALTKRYTENKDAYQMYLKGRYEWNKRSSSGMMEAQRLFRNAIEKDPSFALAYVGLADVSAMSDRFQADLAISKALELDPNLGEAYATRGFIRIFHEWRWQDAESAFKKSIELNPNYATAHHWYAQLLTIQGRHEEAKSEMRRALEINPLSPNFLADLGQIYYFNREFKEAEELCRKALDIYPDFEFAHEYLFDIYLKTGDHDKAVEEMLAADRTHMTFANQADEWKQKIEADINERRRIYLEGGIVKFVESRATQTNDGNLCYVYATSYAFLGEKEKALACLEKAFEGRGFLSVFVKADPVFDDLRSEPRYQKILRKMNL